MTTDERLGHLEARQDAVENQINQNNQLIQTFHQDLSARLNNIDQKTDRVFYAVIGAMGGGFVTVAAAIIVSAFFA